MVAYIHKCTSQFVDPILYICVSSLSRTPSLIHTHAHIHAQQIYLNIKFLRFNRLTVRGLLFDEKACETATAANPKKICVFIVTVIELVNNNNVCYVY